MTNKLLRYARTLLTAIGNEIDNGAMHDFDTATKYFVVGRDNTALTISVVIDGNTIGAFTLTIT